MKNIINKLLPACLLLALTSGCLKDKNFEDGKTGFTVDKTRKFIEIAGPVSGSYGTVLDFSTADTSFTLVTVRLAAAQPAAEDIKVKLVASPATLEAYNDANQTNYTIPPADKYSFDNLTVTIPKGSREGTLDLTFNDPSYLQEGRFALALAIEKVETPGYTLSANFNNQIIFLRVRNAYDGSYTQSGLLTRYAGPIASSGSYVDEYPISGTTAFSTYDTHNIEGQIVIPGFATTYTRFTINPDNTVTISPSDIAPSNAMQNIPGTTSTYNPETKTFNIKGEFLNASGNIRQFSFTMVQQ